jgi:hypothetical protein
MSSQQRRRAATATATKPPAVVWPAEDGRRRAAARRAGLEGVEKRLPAPSTAWTRRSGTLGMLRLRPAPSHRWSTGYRSWMRVVLVVVAAAEVKPGEASRLRPGLMAGSSLGSR